MPSCCSRVAGPGGDWSLSRKVPREDCGKLGVEVYLWAAAGGRAHSGGTAVAQGFSNLRNIVPPSRASVITNSQQFSSASRRSLKCALHDKRSPYPSHSLLNEVKRTSHFRACPFNGIYFLGEFRNSHKSSCTDALDARGVCKERQRNK